MGKIFNEGIPINTRVRLLYTPDFDSWIIHMDWTENNGRQFWHTGHHVSESTARVIIESLCSVEALAQDLQMGYVVHAMVWAGDDEHLGLFCEELEALRHPSFTVLWFDRDRG